MVAKEVIIHIGNAGGRVSESECLGSWPQLASLEKSASVSPTSASQSEWVISVRHISPLLFKNGMQAAGEHDKRINNDQLKQLYCNSPCWMQRKKC